MTVSAIKLSTGEEFIGDSTTLDNGDVTVDNPVTIVQNPNTGQASFAPWFAFSMTRQFKFTPDQIMFNEPAGDEVVSGYQKAFGLIETPPTKKILLAE